MNDERTFATATERPPSKLEAARARAPKADDPGHVHEQKRKLVLGGAQVFSICKCGMCRREGDKKWTTVATYTKGLARPPELPRDNGVAQDIP